MSLLKPCLDEIAKAITLTANKISKEESEKAILMLMKCSKDKSKLIISGVGKSGIVARKIAATFSSIGLVSIFLNPLDAFHGDLGVVSKRDVCIFLSNSGETKELVELCPHIKNRGAFLIGILGKYSSSIGKQCDIVLDYFIDKEVCPLNIAPTTSTSVTMAIGDALAVLWMERQNISLDDFALNHPSGYLGKKLTITVKDLMINKKEFKPLKVNTKLKDIVLQITKNEYGFGWVEDDKSSGEIQGIITDGDLRRSLNGNDSESWTEIEARDLMTSQPITISSDILAFEALEIMENNHKKPISIMPIIDKNNKFKGILRLHDIIQAGL